MTTNDIGDARPDPTGDEVAAAQRVLIVEEDRVEGGMLAFHLRREGLIVMLMASEDEAIDAVAWAPPDAVLVERDGHDIDGFRILSEIQDSPVATFMMADGPLTMQDELEALRLGVVEVFTKPLDPVLLAKHLLKAPARPQTAARTEIPEGAVSGDVRVHDVTTLLRVCQRHRMNARLHVELDGDWAVMLVRHGEVIDAETPAATGRAAVLDALRRAKEGLYVLIPLALDAEELARDDAIRADLPTLVTEAFGGRKSRPLSRPSTREVPLQNPESPRGPLTQPPRRRSEPDIDRTSEYHALPPSGDDAVARGRVKKQVGIPTAHRRSTSPMGSVDGVPARIGLPDTGSRYRAVADRRPAPATPAEVTVARDLTRPPPLLPADAGSVDTPVEGVDGELPPAQITNRRIRKTSRRLHRPTTHASAEEHTAGDAELLADDEVDGDDDGSPRIVRRRKQRPTTGHRKRAEANHPDAAVTVQRGSAELTPGAWLEDALTTVPRDGIVAPVSPAELDPSAYDTIPRGISDGREGPTPEVAADAATDSAPRKRGERARVRRIGTGRFAIGDTDAPDEETDVEVQLEPDISEDTDLRFRRQASPMHRGVLTLGLLLVAALVFVIVRVAGKEAPEPAPPPELPAEIAAQVAFGEGVSAYELAKFDDAAAIFGRLTEDPRWGQGALSGLTMVSYDQGQLKAAAKQLEALGRRAPEDAHVQAYLGVVYQRLGNADAARAAFLRAKRLAGVGPLADRLGALVPTGP